VEQGLLQVLLLLAAAVASIHICHRLRIPTSLGYLFVGVLLGPFTMGPSLDGDAIRLFAEFGIVFLLFTIGLDYSLPQLQTIRNQVLWLGTAQVGLTTLLVAPVAWWAGAPLAAAIVIGAIFAQSSTTVISRQLSEQGEEGTPHARLGMAMSVFQDITAVPLIVLIPVLAAAADASGVAWLLTLAMLKAVLALVVVLVLGRRLLGPLFRIVARHGSIELFTLTVLLAALGTGWSVQWFGLSPAFGAFLAGMVLGETEFRHQVEAAIRPFRDVLLGLFFVGIGMLFDPMALPQVWPWALGGLLVMLAIKLLLVAGLVRGAGLPVEMAWRIGAIIAVGGEFGLALLAIGLASGVLDDFQSQVALTAVLASFVVGPILIGNNGRIARLFTPKRLESQPETREAVQAAGHLSGHVLICGYGRIGQSVGRILEKEGIPHVAVDLDPTRVRQARQAGENVFYGDATDLAMLDALGLARARLVMVCSDSLRASLRIVSLVHAQHPGLAVMVRSRDESQGEVLREAGASEVVPEVLEAGLVMASLALERLGLPAPRIRRLIQDQRSAHYPLLRGHFAGNVPDAEPAEQLATVSVEAESPARGRSLAELGFQPGEVNAIVRGGERLVEPPANTVLAEGDTVVVRGGAEAEALARERLARQ